MLRRVKAPTYLVGEVKAMLYRGLRVLRSAVCVLALSMLLSGTAHAALANVATAPPPPERPPDALRQLLPDFDPILKSVAITTQSAAGTTLTREGKGWLEVTADGRRLIHLRGTPYELGFQQGKLMKPEVNRMVSTILQTVGLAETLHTGEPFVERLRGAYKSCEPFIPREYIEEARGMADGAGLQHEAVLLANIFPELFHCSGFALWGSATRDGKLYHGRILDYMTEIGLQQVATVMVYQPDGKLPFVTIGYAGFIGSVTGMNSERVAIGEMGGGGQGHWNGMPMSYLVRHTLETAHTLDAAVKTFQDTPRTCEYYYVVSDGKIPSARGLAATPEKLEVVMPGEAHPKLAYPIRDAVLLSAGDRYKRLVMRVAQNFGQFTAPEALSLMRRPVAMQSCLHAVLFCPTDLTFWVANATREAKPASEQPYAAYDLRALLAAKPPRP
jgi:hypothetical protein